MKVKKNFKEKLFDVFNIIFMIVIILIMFIPFIHIINTSLSSPKAVVSSSNLFLYPRGFDLTGYKIVLRSPILASAYLNTILYSVSGTILGVLLMSFGGYALSKKYFPGKKVFMIMIVTTMFISGGLIPTYLNIRNLNLIDKRLVMIIPGCISTYSMIIVRTGFSQVPSSLSESAYIDGANDLTILFRIIMPVSKAVLAVVALWSFVGYWNSWFPALIYLKDRGKYPLQIILREIVLQAETSDFDDMLQGTFSEEELYKEVIKYATMVAAIGPVILAYPFFQKYFVKGVMVGSLKG